MLLFFLFFYNVNSGGIIDVNKHYKNNNLSETDKLEKIILELNLDNIELNKENVKNIITLFEIQHPEIVYKQCLLESGNLKSKLTINGNNLFGMRKPGQRDTFAKEKTYKGYATFDSWVRSIADYKIWQGNKPIKNYYNFLVKRKYASDKNYIKKILGN